VLAIGTGFLFLLQSGTNVYQADLLRSRDIDLTLSQLSIVVNAAGTGIGSLLWGRVVENLRVSYTYALVALVMAVASALFVIADTVLLAYIAAGLFGVSVAGILVVPPVAYANFFGRQSLGTIRGVTEPFTSLGQAIGAVASGLVFHFTDSYTFAFVIYAVLGALTAGALLLARPPRYPAVSLAAVQSD
jgi:sugar phosphate permease